MNNRYVILLLCAAALAYACGPWARSQGIPAATVAYHRKTPHEVATTLQVVSSGKHVELALNVANNTSKNVELRFPSGKTHDFVIKDRSGRTVWRWSQGRLFTQTIQNKTLRVRDTLTLQNDWDAPKAHGTYVAVATLNMSSHPIVRRVAFTLR